METHQAVRTWGPGGDVEMESHQDAGTWGHRWEVVGTWGWIPTGGFRGLQEGFGVHRAIQGGSWKIWGPQCGAGGPPGRKEDTFRVVGEDEEADAGGAGAGAKDGDALGVTPKVPHILVEPPQRLDLVQEPVVALCCLVPRAQEACGDMGTCKDTWGGVPPITDQVTNAVARGVHHVTLPNPCRQGGSLWCPHTQPMASKGFSMVSQRPHAQPVSPRLPPVPRTPRR